MKWWIWAAPAAGLLHAAGHPAGHLQAAHGCLFNTLDYACALAHYGAAAEHPADAGEAYFMLGVLHLTGLFGHGARDAARAETYYEFAAENNHVPAAVVLAHKHATGLGRRLDCATAQFYYSRAARHALVHGPARPQPALDVRVPDLEGGWFGRVTEEPLSARTEAAHYHELVLYLREEHMTDVDDAVADGLLAAVDAYYGLAAAPRDAARAFAHAQRCARSPAVALRATALLVRRCRGLAAQMLLDGDGTARSPAEAYALLRPRGKTGPDTHNQLAQLHRLDPTVRPALSENCTRHLVAAASNNRSDAQYALLLHHALTNHSDPLSTLWTRDTYLLMRLAADHNHARALFYVADALESYAARTFERPSCDTIVLGYRAFVEHLEYYTRPYLQYALDSYRQGDREKARVGFAIAAELGSANAQLLVAYLVYQPQPLFKRNKRTFSTHEMDTAKHYLELAAAQGDVDATVLLGDLHSGSSDETAFAYYSRAAASGSPHGCYKLALMFEHGRGTARPDYHMAKRYYDLSIKNAVRRAQLADPFRDTAVNTHLAQWALFRLRVRMLFSKADDEPSWLSTFKTLGKQTDTDASAKAAKADARAAAHHEGTEYDADDAFEAFDYIVLAVTFLFFVVVCYQSVARWLRRVRDPDAANQNGLRFEMHFFAL